MAEKGFFKRLEKLFSTAVVIARPGEGIKVLDVDKLQAYSNLESNRPIIDRYTKLNQTFYSSLGYDQLAGFHTQRNELYRQYEQMEQDPIIASALDIYSDDSTMKNEYGDVLTINSSKEEIQESLRNLFYDILNIEFNMWMWIRTLCKYGDFYLKLDITEQIGITNVIPLSPYAVTRDEDPTVPNLVRFLIDPAQFGAVYAKTHSSTRNSSINKFYFENYEIAHFRLLADSNYLPYGRSMLESGRKIWKQLMLMEDAMLIHRIMRAPEKRIFKIDIGNIPPNEVDAYMNNIINKLKKVPYIDEQTGQYNLEFNLMNMLEDFYLPVRGGNSGTEIDTLSGMEFTGIEDIQYLQNKLFAALKIPKAFLTYEEEINAKATLVSEDVRFARTVERIQKILVSELTKIAIVHLYAQGFKNADLVDFNLQLTISSKEYEKEMIEMWTEKVSLARDMKELKMVSDSWIYDNIFHISDDEAEEERAKIIEDLKLVFRFQQIEDEGNDPAITADAITDIDGIDDGIEPDDKRTKLRTKTFNNEILGKLQLRRKQLIAETYKPKEKPTDKSDDGTFLDENRLMDDEK